MATGGVDHSECLGSEDFYEVVCGPCQEDGELHKAVGSCIDCPDYLCQKCFDGHKIARPFRKHVLKSLFKQDKCTEKCDVHKEVIKFYCIDHCQLGCNDCITIDHRFCDPVRVRYIPKVADDLANNEEYIQADSELKSVLKRSEKVSLDSKQKLESIENSCAEAVSTVKTFRKEMNKFLDKAESELLERCETFKSEETEKMTRIFDKFKLAQKELHALVARKEQHQYNQQNCNLYTVMMKTRAMLRLADDGIKKVEKEHSCISFVPNKETLNTLSHPEALGKLSNVTTLSDFGQDKTGNTVGQAYKSISVIAVKRKGIESDKITQPINLDDKDGEVDIELRLDEDIQEEMRDEEWDTTECSDDYSIQQKVTGLQAHTDIATEGMSEYLNVLEKLTVGYGRKSQEVDDMKKENDSLKEELSQKVSCLNTMESQLDSMKLMKDSSLDQRKRLADMVGSLLKDLRDIGTIVGGYSAGVTMSMGNTEKIEEEFTVARLFISKMKSEVKTLVGRAQHLETTQSDATKKLDTAEKDLSDCRLLIQQHQTKIQSLTETIQDVEHRKRNIEENMDLLNDNLAAATASANVDRAARHGPSDSVQTSMKMRTVLEEQMEVYREQRQKIVNRLRDEIASTQASMETLKDTNQKLGLALERLQNDYDKLKKEEGEKTATLAELSLQIDGREQAKQDLKGLEETVAKELQTLHNLRKLFVQDMQYRVRKTMKKGVDDEEDDVGGSAAQELKIKFLENNINQLTKVHKQLVRDNSDLRCEVPKLERRLRATMDRTKALEDALRDSKEGARRDRKRYQDVVDGIKERIREKNLRNARERQRKQFELICRR